MSKDNEIINPWTDIPAVSTNEPILENQNGQGASGSGAGASGAGIFSSLQIGSGSVGLYANREGMWLGGASFATATFKVNMAGAVTAANFTATNPILNNATLNGALLASIVSGTDIAIQGWSSSLAFSASTYRKVGWTAGVIMLTDGTSFSIGAGDTGDISAKTYIYFDKAVSVTALQKSLTYSVAVGANKILIGVAIPNTDILSLATFQVFGGAGGQTILIDNIVANSACVNELISNSAQIKDATITNAKITGLSVDKLLAGLIVSKDIELSFTEGAGDCRIRAGKTDFTNDETGFIMGIDDSDSNKVKFIIGTPTEYIAILGDTFINTLRVGAYTDGSGSGRTHNEKNYRRQRWHI
jgi:hypothetical protein